MHLPNNLLPIGWDERDEEFMLIVPSDETPGTLQVIGAFQPVDPETAMKYGPALDLLWDMTLRLEISSNRN